MSDRADLSDLDSADYDSEFVAWTKEQALALRRRATNAIDWDNIAEEIESLGKSDLRDLRSRIQTILDHLMRLQASPAQAPRHGWERTLIMQRAGWRRWLWRSSARRHAYRSISSATPRRRCSVRGCPRRRRHERCEPTAASDDGRRVPRVARPPRESPGRAPFAPFAGRPAAPKAPIRWREPARCPLLLSNLALMPAPSYRKAHSKGLFGLPAGASEESITS